MPMIPQSHAIRSALRAALRAAPNGPRGHAVSNMSPAELRAACDALGLDVAAITDAAIAANMAAGMASGGVPSDTDQDQDDMTDQDDEAPDTDQGADDTAATVEAEVSAFRQTILAGGFAALDDKLRDLIRAAHKPPVTVEVIRTVTVDAPSPLAGAITHAAPTGREASWRELFGVRGKLGTRTAKLWDGAHPDTPKSDARYIFPAEDTAVALTQIARGQNAFLYGPKGTGKTAWASELAARTGRPFALISCDNSTDGPTLVGMTVPQAGGGTLFQPGQLTRAISTPGCVVCLDEPSVARPGALFVMQNVLANRVLFVAETGMRIPVAHGVIFIATDNTNGTGGGGRRGYTDTNRMNDAFLDRFGPRVQFSYLPKDQEVRVIMARTGCTKELATLLVDAAIVTRAGADTGALSDGISLRRLFAWAEMLTDGIGAEVAFQCAVLNAASDQDRETLRQQCLLAYDRSAVARALDPVAAAIADAETAAAVAAATAAADAIPLAN